MYMYDYIVNRLHVFTQGHHGNRLASTPYPPEQVCTTFNEFNLFKVASGRVKGLNKF